MQFHFHANQSHFHKNGFTLKLALKQRHKGTRKWPIRANTTVYAPITFEEIAIVTISTNYKLFVQLL